MEQTLGKAVYDAIMDRAQGLNFVDKMVLMNALQTEAEFRAIPIAQQRLFVEVGMAAVRALQAMSAAGGG
jgi:hypothetical protein